MFDPTELNQLELTELNPKETSKNSSVDHPEIESTAPKTVEKKPDSNLSIADLAHEHESDLSDPSITVEMMELSAPKTVEKKPDRTLSSADSAHENESDVLERLKLSAKSGNAKSQIKLGKYYQSGPEESRNFKEAIACYESAAKQGYQEAQMLLGQCYEQGGKGVEKDIEKAIKYYELSRVGNPESQLGLDRCCAYLVEGYKRGEKMERNRQTELGEYFARRATEPLLLGRVVRDEKENQNIQILEFIKDDKHTFECYQLGAALRHTDCQEGLAKCYRLGEGVEKDLKESIRLSKLLTTVPLLEEEKDKWLGNTTNRTYENLRLIYKEIINEYRSMKKEDKCLINALKEDEKKQKAVHSSIILELRLQNPKAVEMNNVFNKNKSTLEIKKKEAFESYHSADHSDPEVQRQLGRCYEEGIGVEKNRSKALELYELSAKQGNSEAYYDLGKYYESSAKQGNSKAREFYQKSADKGCWNAQAKLMEEYLLGDWYFRLPGGKKDVWKKCLSWNFPMSQKEIRNNPVAKKLWETMLDFLGNHRPTAEEISQYEASLSNPDSPIAASASPLKRGMFGAPPSDSKAVSPNQTTSSSSSESITNIPESSSTFDPK